MSSVDTNALFRMLDGTEGSFRLTSHEREQGRSVQVGIYSGRHRDDPFWVAETAIHDRVLRVATMQGSGRLIEVVNDAIEDAAYRALSKMITYRVSEPLDFAAFALDHDDGKGLDVQQAVRELWHASHEQHAKRKEHTRRLLAWAAVSP